VDTAAGGKRCSIALTLNGIVNRQKELPRALLPTECDLADHAALVGDSNSGL
jgi:hypothetical protein